MGSLSALIGKSLVKNKGSKLGTTSAEPVVPDKVSRPGNAASTILSQRSASTNRTARR
jgi:hypothetical protein